MKKLIILPLLLLTLSLGATRVYVATTGNDGTGDGTSGNPYLTIATGISHASAGDTVFIVAGTYNVTAQMAVGTGISIVNNTGTKPVIASSSAIDAIFLLESATEGTNGNQSISGIRFTGGDAVDYGVYIKARSNVSVHDCEFDGFEGYGITCMGGTSGGTGRPVTWATGNKIYNNVITDCGYDVLSGGTQWLVYGGGIHISGQDGALVHDNDINNGEGFGWGIRCLSDSGFIRGTSVYDNKIRTHFRDTLESYNFNIELWTGKGGNRVYNNNCNGGIDLSGYGWDDSGGYGFALDVSDNTVVFDVMPTLTQEAAFIFESGSTGGVYFRRNFAKNSSKGLVLSLRQNSLVQGFDGLYVDYNVFSEIGQISVSMTGTSLEFNAVPSSGYVFPTINDFRYSNNVTYRGAAPVQTYGLNCTAKNTATGVGAIWTNVVATNNISYNVYAPLKWDDQTLDTVNIKSNISYNATNNTRFNSCDTSNVTLETFITSNPLFKSNETFRLRPTSPAIDAGIDVGLTTDYWGHRVPQGSAPDIGAAEYGNYVLFYNGKQLY